MIRPSQTGWSTPRLSERVDLAKLIPQLWPIHEPCGIMDDDERAPIAGSYVV
jgi:hypothetical protein